MSRQPAGIPVGGQFAAAAHAEPDIALAAALQPRNNMPALGSAAAGYTDTFDEAGNLVLQVRLKNGKPNDAPDGTPAIIRYSTNPEGATHATFYTDGVVHDGSGDKPSELLTWSSGRTEIRRGHRRPHTAFFFRQDSPDGQPASVKTSAEGTVVTGHFAQGILQDPAPRVPARVEVRADGTRIEQRAPFGQLEDLPDGTPSEHHYGPAGNLIAEIRRHGDKGWDSDYGDPSERRYRDDGTVYKEVYRYNGSLLDSPTGKPALIEYAADGSIARQVSEPIQWDSYTKEEVRFNTRVTRRQAWPYTRKEPVPPYVPEPPKRTTG
ncbi:hypothetical protein [Arthrobacter sp. UYCo732]|uniref:hypothetical protein n=1 Tax=Arthrobacter sp. UYCo732 TaxID=3156336 RepID=UPI003398C71C